MSVLKIKNTPNGAWQNIATIKGAKGDKGDTGGNVTDAVKLALLQIANHVYYDNDQGPTYIQDLQDALYPPADIVSISAVYTQSGAVYNTDDIDDLKDDLVVTANKTGGTTQTIAAADYTLFGELNIGTQTISVIYRGFVTTFDVVVTREPCDLVNGTYASSPVTGGTVTVSSNSISFGSTQGSNRHYSIPLTNPLRLKAGDVVTFSSADRSVYNTNTLTVGFNGSALSGGGNYCPLQPLDKTVTMANDLTVTSLYVGPPGAMANTSFTFVLKVNGEVVI